MDNYDDYGNFGDDHDDGYDGEPEEEENDDEFENDDEDFGDGDIDVDDDEFARKRFADPGGKSALHRASPCNPRNLPCPTCERENKLTARDVAQGYQCDSCADAAEGGGY